MPFIGLAIFFVVLWLLGFFFFHIAGWFIHLLLIAAAISILIRIIKGEKK